MGTGFGARLKDEKKPAAVVARVKHNRISIHDVAHTNKNIAKMALNSANGHSSRVRPNI